jgi:RNA polymerase sigma factor (sigma-70 family)
VLTREEITNILHNRKNNNLLLMESFKPFIMKTCILYYGLNDEDAIQNAYIVLFSITKKFKRLLKKGYIKECCYVKYITTSITYSILKSWYKQINLNAKVELREMSNLYIPKYNDEFNKYDHKIVFAEDKKIINKLICTLTNRERKLIRLYYLGNKRITLRQLAKKYHLSRQCLFRIISKGIYKLRNKFVEKEAT